MSKVVALIARLVIFQLFLSELMIFLLECILTIKYYIFSQNLVEDIIFLGEIMKKEKNSLLEIFVFSAKNWYRYNPQP